MALSDAQTARVRIWLRDKCGELRCSACQGLEWQLGDVIAPPSSSNSGGNVLGGTQFPMLQVICQKCGHVALFSTLSLGIELVET